MARNVQIRGEIMDIIKNISLNVGTIIFTFFFFRNIVVRRFRKLTEMKSFTFSNIL